MMAGFLKTTTVYFFFISSSLFMQTTPLYDSHAKKFLSTFAKMYIFQVEQIRPSLSVQFRLFIDCFWVALEANDLRHAELLSDWLYTQWLTIRHHHSTVGARTWIDSIYKHRKHTTQRAVTNSDGPHKTTKKGEESNGPKSMIDRNRKPAGGYIDDCNRESSGII